MKIVLIGAGSAQFGFGMLGDIFHSATLRNAEIALVDIDGAALERVRAAAEAFVAEKKLPFRLVASTDRRTVLKGADFVVISIEVGQRFELWDEDWNIPLQYGIRQVYGENGGPGGLFHALRITPPILDICTDVESLCPDAFVLNYSNPMTTITTTVLRRSPGLKFVGMCHEIASIRRCLPPMLGTTSANLKFRAAGLNHCSVLLEVSYVDTGRDAYPEVLAKAPAFFERLPGFSDVWAFARRTGSFPETEGSMRRYRIDVDTSSRPWSDRTLFREILDKFHLLPITHDSHLGEFIPWAHGVVDHQGILDFYAFYRERLARARPGIQLGTKERAVPVMEGIIDDRLYEEAAVNVLNAGYIPDLPGFIAVEVPGLVSGKGIEGVRFPSYPKAFGALLRNYCGVYDLTAEAVLQGKRDLVIQALLVNPLVADCSRIGEMVDVMLERQNEWLSYIQS